MQVRCIYSTLTCSFSRLLASLANTDRHWSNSYAVLSLKKEGRLMLRCNLASKTLSKLQYFPQFPVLRHQITWIRWKLHFSLLCRPGEIEHNEKSKRKMKTESYFLSSASTLLESRGSWDDWLAPAPWSRGLEDTKRSTLDRWQEIYLCPLSELRPSWLRNQRFDLSLDRVRTTECSHLNSSAAWGCLEELAHSQHTHTQTYWQGQTCMIKSCPKLISTLVYIKT